METDSEWGQHPKQPDCLQPISLHTVCQRVTNKTNYVTLPGPRHRTTVTLFLSQCSELWPHIREPTTHEWVNSLSALNPNQSLKAAKHKVGDSCHVWGNIWKSQRQTIFPSDITEPSNLYPVTVQREFTLNFQSLFLKDGSTTGFPSPAVYKWTCGNQSHLTLWGYSGWMWLDVLPL